MESTIPLELINRKNCFENFLDKRKIIDFLDNAGEQKSTGAFIAVLKYTNAARRFLSRETMIYAGQQAVYILQKVKMNCRNFGFKKLQRWYPVRPEHVPREVQEISRTQRISFLELIARAVRKVKGWREKRQFTLHAKENDPI